MSKITFCKKNEFNSLLNFLKKNWLNKNTVFSNKNFFHWMYFNKKLKKYNFLIYKKNKKIRSCLGFFLNSMPLKRVIWLSLWLVDSKNRKNINGLELIFYLIKKFNKCIIVTNGANPKTIPIYNSLNFKIKYLNHYYIVNSYIKNFKLIKFKNKKKINIKKNKNKIIILKKIDSLKKELDLKKFHNLFLKNINYYIEKYQNHPIYNYEFYLIKKRNKFLGFFIGRICKFKNRKALRFVEYFGSLREIKNLKFNLYNLLKEKKYEYLDFYNLGIDKKILKKAGFEQNKFTKNIIIPNYFETFVKENINICTAVWPKKTQLLIFKGDGDQDRPRI